VCLCWDFNPEIENPGTSAAFFIIIIVLLHNIIYNSTHGRHMLVRHRAYIYFFTLFTCRSNEIDAIGP